MLDEAAARFQCRQTMTADQFWRLVLSLPASVARKVLAIPDYPLAESAVVRVSPEDQGFLVRAHAKVLTPVNGAWGARGSTRVALGLVGIAQAREALETAWRRRAPRRLLDALTRLGNLLERNS